MQAMIAQPERRDKPTPDIDPMEVEIEAEHYAMLFAITEQGEDDE